MKISERNKDYFHQVYQVVREIPEGRVTSYGAIANYLGVKSGARMVGWAMNGSHQQDEYVPAHRVLNRNGQLTGKMHFEDPCEMERLLKKEGIEVVNDQVVMFESIFWDPSIELTL